MKLLLFSSTMVMQGRRMVDTTGAAEVASTSKASDTNEALEGREASPYSWGVWGALKAPQGGPGAAPEAIDISTFFSLKLPYFAQFQRG